MKPRLRPLVFCVILAVVTPFVGRAQAPAGRELRDVPYTEAGKEPQMLDLYLPADDGKEHPLVVWIHGGGWSMGGRRPCPSKPLTGYGYAVASVSYRFSQQAIFPAQIEDCKAALRFLRAHAAEYHIDPARVGVAGESAGGHLVALLGTTGGTKQFDVGSHLDQSSAVQCVIDLYGPSDFLHWGDNTDPSLETPFNGLARLVGGKISTHQEAARTASPFYDVSKESVPFLIFHGDKDPIVPLQQSQVLDAALRQAGVASTLYVLPGAGHGGPQFGTPENLKTMFDFLEKHLKPGANEGTGK